MVYHLVVKIGPYPVEVSFYPEHLIIPLMTLLIFVIILYVIARIKKKQITGPTNEGLKTQVESRRALVERRTTREHTDKNVLKQAKEEVGSGRLFVGELKAGDTISLVALIGTIVAALVVPFSQLPVLDYTVSGPFSADGQNNQKFEVVVHNYGTITAKNVIVSFKADQTKFVGFSSLPYLANHFKPTIISEGNEIGKAIVEIKQLPARSHTVINAVLSPVSRNQEDIELITYVR